MTNLDDLRLHIRQRMAARNLSLRQLGELSGVAHTTIAGWLGTATTDPRPPRLDAALAVARALGISLDRLGKKNRKKNQSGVLTPGGKPI